MTNSLEFSSRFIVMRLLPGSVKKTRVVTRWGLFLVRGGSSPFLHSLFFSPNMEEECVLVGETYWSIPAAVRAYEGGEKHFKLFMSFFGLSRARTHPSRLPICSSLASWLGTGVVLLFRRASKGLSALEHMCRELFLMVGLGDLRLFR